MIGAQLARFLTDHDVALATPFGKTPHTNIITEELPDKLRQLLPLNKEYRVYGSCGTGNWAETPWVAVLDKSVTRSTTSGYYIVFLLDTSHKQVVLALGVGWTQFAERYPAAQAHEQIINYGQYLVARLAQIPAGFATGKIDLHAKGALTKGYEYSEIISKTYSYDKLADEAQIISDFKALVSLYSQLSSEVGDTLLNIDLTDLPTDSETALIDRKINAATLEPNTSKALAGLTDFAATLPPERKERVVRKIVRKPKFAEFIKERVGYVCEICGRKPFIQKNKKPYAEADHITSLGGGGLDHPDNMRCICAQCHAVVTHGSKDEIDNLLGVII